MIIKPKTRGFICTTAHPEGCKKIISDQIEYAKAHKSGFGCKKVLVIGASMGYGLSARVAAAYSCGASTIGVIFDKEGSEKRPASAGWYNTAAFEEFGAARLYTTMSTLPRSFLIRSIVFCLFIST